ncbi:acyl-CoA thioesterase domain-containing protein [Streptomyces sp. NPDC002088]|uniref:acyl-CoA thioesterase n=1 Tax=Streptomyces sp. NPDC002088 TaxID=3154665 RepID=UPI00331F3B83
MTDLWNDLLDCLAPKPLGQGVYEARSQHLDYHRLFGGQLLAQSVRVAELTCPGKAVKSLHVLFPREGRGGEPVRYETDCVQQGRTYAAVQIQARQEHGVVAVATASLHTWEGGPQRQSTAPVGPLPGEERRIDLDLLPWETRSATDLDSPGSEPPAYELWTRTPTVAADLGPALLTYATDLTLIGTALRPVAGVTQHDAGRAFTSAVTSHSVWFHQPLRTDSWLVLRQHSPVAAHGRCHGRGDVLTEQGELVASYTQDALLRFAQQ